MRVWVRPTLRGQIKRRFFSKFSFFHSLSFSFFLYTYSSVLLIIWEYLSSLHSTWVTQVHSIHICAAHEKIWVHPTWRSHYTKRNISEEKLFTLERPMKTEMVIRLVIRATLFTSVKCWTHYFTMTQHLTLPYQKYSFKSSLFKLSLANERTSSWLVFHLIFGIKTR